MRWALGVLSAIAAWLGWLAVCSALGFPTLATAAMLNLTLVPKQDPGFWLGWVMLVLGLIFAALLYLVAADRGRLRPSIASGLAYGAIAWLVAGALVMPVLAFLAAAPAPSAPGVTVAADPMRGSFMMLNLGVGAPLAALVAWLLFGTILGAVARVRPSEASGPTPTRVVALGGLVSFLVLVALVLLPSQVTSAGPVASTEGIQTIATMQVASLPKGDAFISVIELSQSPGGRLGPHSHTYSGVAYSLRGVTSLAVDGQTTRVSPGEATWVLAGKVHTHLNEDGQVASGILALLIVALTAIVAFLSLRVARYGRRAFFVALSLLLVVGAIGVLNPLANDWLYISVRSVSNRGAEMPIATSSRLFESANVGPFGTGPYTETLEEITVGGDSQTSTLGLADTAALVVLDGQVDVQSATGTPTTLGNRAAMVLKPGSSVQVSNHGTGLAHLLQLTLSPATAGN